ncbi:MAG TPA: hypothetical protein VE775_08055, partial [Pyrinomonadaceae bacterium]|nr:hypothetical protein [Pyrinomonadaceae bacterium]
MQNFPPPGQNYPPPGGAYPPPPQTPAPPPKSKTPWLIAGVGCLVLLVVGAIALIGGLAYIGKQVQSTQPTHVPAASQRAGTQQYVNSRAGRTGPLAENYVDFSFYYPDDWTLVPNQKTNFVKVERSDENKTTLENFAVGWVSASGTALDKKLMPQLAQQITSQFAQSFQDFEKASEGATKVGAYEGYEVKFKAKLPGTPRGDADIYGRVVLLPPPAGQTKGVALVMLATSLAPEINGLDDVGVAGEMPVIL